MGSFGSCHPGRDEFFAQHPPCSPLGPLMYPPPHPGEIRVHPTTGFTVNPLNPSRIDRAIRFLIHFIAARPFGLQVWDCRRYAAHSLPLYAKLLFQPGLFALACSALICERRWHRAVVFASPIGFALRLDVGAPCPIGPTHVMRVCRRPNGHFVLRASPVPISRRHVPVPDAA